MNYQNITNPQIIYARISNATNNSCYLVSSLQIAVDYLPSATKPSDINICSDASGVFSATINLQMQNAAILNGQTESSFSITYYKSLIDAVSRENSVNINYEATMSPEILYARVENFNDHNCYAITDFQINIFPKPLLEMEETYSLCEKSRMIISAPNGFDAYNWSTGETGKFIIVTSPGTISLTVTRDYGIFNCTDTVNFSVIESPKPIINEVQISDWTENQNSIYINATGAGIFEYSIDGQEYQDSPYFYGVEMGEHIVYVKDKFNCGIASKEVYMLMYPKFFTPNGDTHNEKWQIRFAQSEPNLEVQIFDKYGKLIVSMDGKSEGWDGTRNNIALPSSDYWFVVKRKSGIAYKGHFSLLR